MPPKRLLTNFVLAFVVPLACLGLSTLTNTTEVKLALANAGLAFFFFMLIFRVGAPIIATSLYIVIRDPVVRSRLESPGMARLFLINDARKP